MTNLEFYAAIATPVVAGIFITVVCAVLSETDILQSANTLPGRFHQKNTLHAAASITQLEYFNHLERVV